MIDRLVWQSAHEHMQQARKGLIGHQLDVFAEDWASGNKVASVVPITPKLFRPPGLYVVRSAIGAEDSGSPRLVNIVGVLFGISGAPRVFFSRERCVPLDAVYSDSEQLARLNPDYQAVVASLKGPWYQHAPLRAQLEVAKELAQPVSVRRFGLPNSVH